MDDRSIALAEFVFAWVELREHILGSVARSNSNVHTALAMADRRLATVIAAQSAANAREVVETDSIVKTLGTRARER